ncbi:hypothetical protein SCE1572_04115 [Sorangium cellulosum So0157-2]|uniref:Uncharacterized protein n=1 Tax=Sorangium cellulosum So0157-2 TaxID=1254432 RepID=S4XT40_SORCE|nr:hypothetical protein SCE1572_04115 [Sorangium cellulosum So0157-2]
MAIADPDTRPREGRTRGPRSGARRIPPPLSPRESREPLVVRRSTEGPARPGLAVAGPGASECQGNAVASAGLHPKSRASTARPPRPGSGAPAARYALAAEQAPAGARRAPGAAQTSPRGVR